MNMKLFGKNICPTKKEIFSVLFLLGSVDYALRIYKDQEAGTLNIMFFAALISWHIIEFTAFICLGYYFLQWFVKLF